MKLISWQSVIKNDSISDILVKIRPKIRPAIGLNIHSWAKGPPSPFLSKYKVITTIKQPIKDDLK